MSRIDGTAASGEIVTTPEKRHLGISRPSETRVRFLNSQTPELAEKFILKSEVE
jgi:hypothetical protein